MKLEIVLFSVSLTFLSLLHAQESFGTYKTFDGELWQSCVAHQQRSHPAYEPLYPTMIPALTYENLPDRRSDYTWVRDDYFQKIDAIVKGQVHADTLYPIKIYLGMYGDETGKERYQICWVGKAELESITQKALLAERNARRAHELLIISIIGQRLLYFF